MPRRRSRLAPFILTLAVSPVWSPIEYAVAAVEDTDASGGQLAQDFVGHHVAFCRIAQAAGGNRVAFGVFAAAGQWHYVIQCRFVHRIAIVVVKPQSAIVTQTVLGVDARDQPGSTLDATRIRPEVLGPGRLDFCQPPLVLIHWDKLPPQFRTDNG